MANTNPVKLIAVNKGADFTIDLSAFPEVEPVFAYVDDMDCDLEVLNGLVIDGQIRVDERPPFMWLEGERNCIRLKASIDCRNGEFASFRSLTVGEFCVEIYYITPGNIAQLLYQDDFCFK
jgi:hypothetical protein